jgi:formylglycine-generating enzyme required for sulfatase activity
LNALCFDYFPDVAQEFSQGMMKGHKVQHVIGYLERRGRLEELHNALVQARPAQYRHPNRYTHPKTGIELIRIPAGDFLYGGENEKRRLPEFWIGRTPVTHQQYQHFIDAKPKYGVPHSGFNQVSYNWDRKKRTYPPDKADHPVVYVSAEDAEAFCAWFGFYLPSEEEWEKAARGTDGRTYPWGEEPPTADLCNFAGNAYDTTPVGRYSPQGDSPYGCVDMAGNVWEWTSSWYEEEDEEEEPKQIIRGGAHRSFKPELLRCATRVKLKPGGRYIELGFRVAASSLKIGRG